METVQIRDPGWKKIGSGINIPDPQHWFFWVAHCQTLIISCPHLILNLLLHLVDDLRLELGQQVQDGFLVHALAAHKRVLHTEANYSVNQPVNQSINQLFERKQDTGCLPTLLLLTMKWVLNVEVTQSVNQSTNHQSVNQSVIWKKTGYRLLGHALAAHKQVRHPRSVNQSTNQPFKRNWIKASCTRSCC